jgi:hypothetical protein
MNYMKLYPECVPCMLQRGMLFCEEESEETKMRAAKALCALFSRAASENTTTTCFAYERNRLIEKLIKNKDPMKALKEESFSAAERLYPRFRKLVSGEKDDRKRFRLAAKVALAGNIIEFGARDHKVNLKELEAEIMAVVDGKLVIDDLDKIYGRARSAKEILYVTDNAAEVVFDKIFIEELLKYAKVYVAPLSQPVQDDAWTHETTKAGLDRICPIIPRGNFIGIWFEKCTPAFLSKFGEADLIIAKGMGCYETLVDHPEKLTCKIGLLMKAKCLPVAKNIGVPVGSAVAKLL